MNPSPNLIGQSFPIVTGCASAGQIAGSLRPDAVRNVGLEIRGWVFYATGGLPTAGEVLGRTGRNCLQFPNIPVHSG